MKTRQCREPKWTNRALEQPGAAQAPALHSVFAFTLVEMLVVIAIIGMLAGLVLYLGPGIHDSQRRKTVHAQMEQLTALIEYYKEDNGFYPPDNKIEPGRNTLYYELTGTNVAPALLKSFFDVDGIINSAEGNGKPKNFYPNIQTNRCVVNLNTAESPVYVLGLKIKGPGNTNFCAWNYRVPTEENATTIHNPKGFDLWMTIDLSKGPTIIGNWKDKE